MSLRLYCLPLLVLSFAVVGCSKATHAPVDVSASTVKFSVPDMMCPEGCGAKTKEILAEQPGVKDVLIEFESKTAVVAVEDGKFDSDAALAALVDHGFDHSALKSEGTVKP
jgi:copper chaperone CopZ